MATYPQAYYVNVLDGVAGSLRFRSSADGNYQHMGVGVSPVFTTNFAGVPAVLDVSPAAPSPSTATWQSGVATWSFDGQRVTMTFNGSLPPMNSGAQPCGWLLREHAWQVEVTSGGLTTASAFSDANDPAAGVGSYPANHYPLFLVPYFGNYTIQNGLVISPANPAISGATYTDGVVIVSLPKYLNANQLISQMTFSVNSVAGGGNSALPAVVVNSIPGTFAQEGSSPISGFSFHIPVSLAPDGVLIPGDIYNVAFSVTQTLTYLKGADYVTETITVCSGATAITIPQVSSGPTITSASFVGSLNPLYFSAFTSAGSAHPDEYCLSGIIIALLNADSAAGVNADGVRLVFPGGATLLPTSVAQLDSTNWQLTYNLNTVPAGRYAAYVSVPTMEATPHWSNANINFGDHNTGYVQIADTTQTSQITTADDLIIAFAALNSVTPAGLSADKVAAEQARWATGLISFDVGNSYYTWESWATNSGVNDHGETSIPPGPAPALYFWWNGHWRSVSATEFVSNPSATLTYENGTPERGDRYTQTYRALAFRSYTHDFLADGMAVGQTVTWIKVP